ncbi:hypothetical protein Plec18167_004081 [Paecilomyces lecythidis]|uniref:Uncharacterized protein n=1 Tax=Paecilomyces lecythidis TaxID=3004212 RepID=A0ABR3XVP4_9EURO
MFQDIGITTEPSLLSATLEEPVVVAPLELSPKVAEDDVGSDPPSVVVKGVEDGVNESVNDQEDVELPTAVGNAPDDGADPEEPVPLGHVEYSGSLGL